MFAAYRELDEFIQKQIHIPREANIPIDPPTAITRLLVCGAQSTGKSSLVESFLGFPCSYVSASVGTRCPVKYRLQRAVGDVPALPVTFQSGQEAACTLVRADLAEAINQHMLNLANTDSFTTVFLNVTVQSPNYLDFERVDLPGFERQRQTGAAQELASAVRLRSAHNFDIEDVLKGRLGITVCPRPHLSAVVRRVHQAAAGTASRDADESGPDSRHAHQDDSQGHGRGVGDRRRSSYTLHLRREVRVYYNVGHISHTAAQAYKCTRCSLTLVVVVLLRCRGDISTTRTWGPAQTGQSWADETTGYDKWRPRSMC